MPAVADQIRAAMRARLATDPGRQSRPDVPAIIWGCRRLTRNSERVFPDSAFAYIDSQGNGACRSTMRRMCETLWRGSTRSCSRTTRPATTRACDS